MKLLVHIDQYDMVGILPSQLESLSLLCSAMGVSQAAYIDNTLDGFKNIGGFTKFKSLSEFLEIENGPFIVFTPNGAEDIRETDIPEDSWLIFGPSMGFQKEDFDKVETIKIKVPGGTMNSRDVVPIALWKYSKWQEQ